MHQKEEEELKLIIDKIGSLARLEFNEKLDLDESSDDLTTIVARGLNMLGEELESAVVDKRELEISEQKFRFLAENVPDNFAFIDENEVYQFVNRSYSNIVGKKPDEIIGKTVSEILGPAYTQLEDYIRKALQGEEVTFEIKAPVPTGEVRIMNGKYFPNRDEDGNVYGFFALIRDVTDIRLRESKEKLFFEALDNSLNEIYIFRADNLKFTYVNLGARKNLGYSKKELTNFTPLDLKKSMTRIEFDDVLSPLNNGKSGSITFETVHYRKDGSHYPVEVKLSKSSMPDADVFVAIIVDITERKKAENLVLQSLNNYQKLFNSSNIGIFVVDLKTNRIIRSNTFGSQQMGYKVHDLNGQKFSAYFHPTDRELIDEMFKSIATMDQVSLEARQLVQNGGSIYTELLAKQLMLEGRTVALVFVQDVTAKKNNEFLLRKSEQKFRELYNGNMAGLYRVTLDYTIVECNEAFAQIIGYSSRQEVIGKNVKSLFKDDKKGNGDEKQVTLGELHCYETKIELPNGEEKWILENIKLIFDDERKPIFIEGTILDISDRYTILQKLEIEKRERSRFKSRLLSSQLNPHFIFNTLNSFQYYILNEKVEDSLNFISNFSVLMRKVLENSLHDFISLSDEIKFLENYLTISKARKTGNFDFAITVNGRLDTDSCLIPPMLLQPYIENSIIHGFGAKKEEGLLSISFEQDKDRLLCIIQDDGVGRLEGKKSKVVKEGPEHRSLGMGIINDRIELLNEIHNNNFTVEIQDLIDESNENTGTRVIISYDLITEED